MLLGGILARNAIDPIVGEMDEEWSLEIRALALTVILYRAGIGLDVRKLKSTGAALLRLTAMPQLFEACAAGVVAHYLFDISWAFSLALGFMMGAVSPAVVVPSCINLQNQGYGIDKGIPSVIIAASSLDDVLAISLFGLFVGIGFGSSEDDHGLFDEPLMNALLVGPIEIFGGILVGVLLGLIIRIFHKIKDICKTVLLFIVCYSLVLVCSYFGLSGLGFLACITTASVCGTKWGPHSVERIEKYVGYLWIFLQIPLFGLVGASVYFADLEGDYIWKAVIVIVIGLIIRMPIAFLAIMRTEFNLKERIFIMIAWMPKATVQAALGGVVLGRANDIDDDDLEDVGMIFLTVAVFCILITAPIGAVLTAVLGPRFLNKSIPNRKEEHPVITHQVIPDGEEENKDIDKMDNIEPDFAQPNHIPDNEMQAALNESSNNLEK